MLSQVTFNKERWISSIMLDPVTGLDPPGAKVRAAEGIEAASSLIQGYWIWYAICATPKGNGDLIIYRSKIIQNLAVVNYDPNNLYLAPYDWRVSYYNLEERDGYFSKLKVTIEGLRCASFFIHDMRVPEDRIDSGKIKRSSSRLIPWVAQSVVQLPLLPFSLSPRYYLCVSFFFPSQ